MSLVTDRVGAAAAADKELETPVGDCLEAAEPVPVGSVVGGKGPEVGPFAGTLVIPWDELSEVRVASSLGPVDLGGGGWRGFVARNFGVTVSEPWYRGHPGTDLGGARPPPQSTPAHISSVSGTYQTMDSYVLP